MCLGRDRDVTLGKKGSCFILEVDYANKLASFNIERVAEKYSKVFTLLT